VHARLAALTSHLKPLVIHYNQNQSLPLGKRGQGEVGGGSPRKVED